MGEMIDKKRAQDRAKEKEKLDSENTVMRALKGVPDYWADKAKNWSSGATKVIGDIAPVVKPKPVDDGETPVANKRGGSIKKFAKGGSIDGIARKGKTRGRYI